MSIGQEGITTVHCGSIILTIQTVSLCVVISVDCCVGNSHIAVPPPPRAAGPAPTLGTLGIPLKLRSLSTSNTLRASGTIAFVTWSWKTVWP
jgi:hypothetical protein